MSNECIPFSWFREHPDLTVWEAVAVYICDQTDYNMRTGAEAVGKSYFNIRQTYYRARQKMKEE